MTYAGISALSGVHKTGVQHTTVLTREILYCIK